MSEKENILIIEDDGDIRECVRILLESEGYRITEAKNGSKGLEMFNDETDLVLLDIMLPDISGLRICEEIRKRSFAPILFLTAKDMESDKLIGLMAGGDDYLTKPFSYAELLGRVRALLRRYKVYNNGGEFNAAETNPFIEMNGIRINTEQNQVYVEGDEADLTELEYRILLLLMKNPYKIFSAQNLYESIWNEPYFYNCNGTVLVHMRKLRVKIEKDPHEPQYIKTIWGKGYRFGQIR